MKNSAELKLTKQRTNGDRKVAALNKSRAEQAEKRSQMADDDTEQDFLNDHYVEKHPESHNDKRQKVALSSIRLKGVDLPVFSGEKKSDYESWKAAFLAAVA